MTNKIHKHVLDMKEFEREHWRKFKYLYLRNDGKYSRARLISYCDKEGRSYIETESGAKFNVYDSTYKFSSNRFNIHGSKYHIHPEDSLVHQLRNYDSCNDVVKDTMRELQKNQTQAKEKKMTCKTESLLATLLMEDQKYVTVNCSFDDSGKTYSYLSTVKFAETLSEGDSVIVPNGIVHRNLNSFLTAKRKSITVAKVVSIDTELDIDLDKACINYKPILQLLDVSEAKEFSDLHNTNSHKVKRALRKKKVAELLKDFK